MKSVAAFLVVALIWFCGLLAYASRVQHLTPAPLPDPAQGIVALTGAGSNERIGEAMDLLENGYGRRLLVSGVNPKATRDDIRNVSRAVRRLYDCCVDLGFTAADTVGNARETADWARHMRYDRLIVVTADYHMPRAMLELNAVLRGTGIVADTYAVATPSLKARGWWRSPRAARLMVVEYCKYLAILGREGILGLGPREAPAAPQKGNPVTVVRSLIYVALFYLWTAAVAVLATPLLLGPRRWTHAMFHFWGHGVTGMLPVCGIRVEVRGQQYIPKGAALVAPKHQCMLDVFAQFTWLPASAFVMKQELKWIPWFGWYSRKAGAIVIDRDGGAKTMRQVIREGTALFAQGAQVVIFPEGTRKAPGDPPDYKPGIAALYRELDVPVYPVATNAGVHWPAHGFIRHPGVIVLEYLEPIPPGLKRAEFMRLLEERIEAKSNELLGL